MNAGCLVFVVLLSAMGMAQTLFQQLSPSEVHPLSWPTGSPVLPLKCDEDGNVYARFLLGVLPSPSSEIVKIAPDGTKKATFDYARVPDLGKAFAPDFSIGVTGELYEVVEVPTRKGNQVLLLRFSENGTFQGKAELTTPKPFAPSQVLALRDGNLLISGVLEEGSDKGRAFNGIFSTNGQLIRKFGLKGEPEPKSNPAISSEDAMLLNPGALSARAMLGLDGNVYIFHQVSPARLYVVSPSGQLLRTLTLAPPKDKAEPSEAAMGSTSMAIEFQVPEEKYVSITRIRLVSLQTGEPIADYEISPGLGQIACYASDKFTFIRMIRNQQSLIHASTH